MTRKGTFDGNGVALRLFGNFSTQDERYYATMEGSMRGEIEPTQGEIEMNLGNGRWEGGN